MVSEQPWAQAPSLRPSWQLRAGQPKGSVFPARWPGLGAVPGETQEPLWPAQAPPVPGSACPGPQTRGSDPKEGSVGSSKEGGLLSPARASEQTLRPPPTPRSASSQPDQGRESAPSKHGLRGAACAHTRKHPHVLCPGFALHPSIYPASRLLGDLRQATSPLCPASVLQKHSRASQKHSRASC